MNTRARCLSLLLSAALAGGTLSARPLGDNGAAGTQAWINRPDLLNLASTATTEATVTGGFAKSGEVLAVAWEAFVDEEAATDMRILLTLWNTDGSVADFTNLVVATGTGKRSHPVVTDDGAGGFWIVWRDFRDDPAGLLGRLYAQRLRRDGATWTLGLAANGVALHDTALAFYEVAALGTTGTVHVGWIGGTAAAQNRNQVRAQRLSTDGTRLAGADGEIIVATSAQAQSVTMIEHPAAGAVLAWARAPNANIITPLVVVPGSGQPPFDLHAGLAVPPVAWFLDPAIVTRGGTDFLMVGVGGRTLRVHQLAIDGAGAITKVTPDGGIVVASVTYETPVRVLPSDTAGEFFTVWFAQGSGMRAQRFDAANAPLWDPAGRDLGNYSDEHAAVRAPDGGFYLAVYGPGGARIAKRFDAAGVSSWTGSYRQVHRAGTGTGGEIVDATTLGDDLVVLLRWSRNVAGFGTFRGIAPVKLNAADGLLPQSRLVNLSTRAHVGTGDNVAIPGFVVAGDTGTKDLLVRAVGPTLGQAPFNVGGVLADPVAELFQQGGGSLRIADDWGDEANQTELTAATLATGAFGLPAGSADAAFVRTYQRAGYTTVVSGAGQTTGVALLEVYDRDTDPTPGTVLFDPVTGLRQPRLSNISTRAVAGTGDAVVILGFVVRGPGTSTVYVRCVGPTLGQPPYNVGGVLPDPVFTVYDRNNAPIFVSRPGDPAPLPQNDMSLQAARSSVGAFATSHANDIAAVLVLNPGLYTVVASSVSGASGVCLTELYDYPLTNVVP